MLVECLQMKVVWFVSALWSEVFSIYSYMNLNEPFKD